MRAVLVAALLILPLSAAATAFRFPLTECSKSGGCYVTAYFDLNRTSGPMRDWNCGSNTYDNHSGTDFGIGGFAGMDANGSRPVVAGAAGTVIARADGFYDRNTSATGTNCSASVSCGNYVKLRHADGKETLYCHMKKGSVAVANGAKVSCGTVLGRVGSSGCSTGPHLHFGVNAGGYDCPYAAKAGCGGSTSYWVSQGAYNGLPSATCECTPNCSGKVCGANGCGGSCGSCAAGQSCNSAGQCVCVPQCSGKVCGSNGCGGTCGTCAAGKSCNSAGQCVCTPQCSGKTCGPNGCGGSCGTCAADKSCNGAGQCVCTPQCSGKTCGPDGCGGTCGTCPSGKTCSSSGQCACVPNCAGKVCGPDDCGGSCGQCPAPATCDATGQCACAPQCDGKQCGPDGCGGACGECGGGAACTPEGQCVAAAPDGGEPAPGPDPGESCDGGGTCSPQPPCPDGGCAAAAPVIEVAAQGCGCQSAPEPALFAAAFALLAPWIGRRRSRRASSVRAGSGLRQEVR